MAIPVYHSLSSSAADAEDIGLYHDLIISNSYIRARSCKDGTHNMCGRQLAQFEAVVTCAWHPSRNFQVSTKGHQGPQKYKVSLRHVEYIQQG